MEPSEPSHPDGLVFEAVHHAYDGKPSIRGVDLAAGRDEIVCLLGPSGCGKTTLLRIAAGLERQSAGRVLVAGREVAGPGCFLPPEKRHVGLMFQDLALFPHMNVQDNVGFGLPALARAERRQEVDGLLARLELGHLARAYPHELSGGERQRVALARALAPKPGVLLLDEPFSDLDEGLRRRVRDDTLRVLRAHAVPALLVTHDAEEALALADRIALMRDGALVQCGPPHALYRSPASPFVARFFGAEFLSDGRVRAGRVETPLGPAASRCGEGCKVRVYVRPEAFELVEGGAEGVSALPAARVLESRLLGLASRLTLAVNGHPAPLAVDVADGALPQVGDIVRIRLDPRRTFVFPATQDI